MPNPPLDADSTTPSGGGRMSGRCTHRQDAVSLCSSGRGIAQERPIMKSRKPRTDPDRLARARTLRRNMTPPERRLWALLRRKRFNVRFRPQHPIGPYFADFYCHSHRLIIEIDGQTHDYTVEQDQCRTEWLESQGYRILRFSNEQIRDNIEGVAYVIEQWLTEQAGGED